MAGREFAHVQPVRVRRRAFGCSHDLWRVMQFALLLNCIDSLLLLEKDNAEVERSVLSQEVAIAGWRFVIGRI